MSLLPAFNLALPGLTPNLCAIPSTTWNALSPERQVETLDDAVGFLRQWPTDAHAPLIARLEQQIWQLSNGRPMEPKLWDDLSQALRDINRSGYEQQSPHPVLERFRLITRPLHTEQAPGILLRGPAHLIRTTHAGSDLMEEFGKAVAESWGHDFEAARAAFRRWAGSGMEIQSLCTTETKRDEKIRALALAGFDVRTAPIPWAIPPIQIQREEPVEYFLDRPIVHWIAARRHEIPLETWFRHFIDAADQAPHRQIRHLDILGRKDVSVDDPQTADDLKGLFGRPVNLANLRQGFAIDVPGYVTNRVSLQYRDNNAGVSLLTEITTLRGEIAARLTGSLPPAPPIGEPWVAWGDDLNEHLYGTTQRDQLLKHISQGIGRRSLARILVFLHRLGVNALDMTARGHGLIFMPKIGFDFQDDVIRRKVLRDFQAFVEKRDSNMSKATRQALRKVHHAWDVCEFQNDRGEDLGQQFLLEYANKRKASILLRFHLDAHFEGWRRLFSKQLSIRPELDPLSQLPEADLGLLDRAMQERARLLTRSPLLVDPSDLFAAQRHMAELQELAIYLSEKAERAQTRADHDGLTGLLLRKALLEHNRELEQSLSANRKSDRINDHWVLMLDIDHFKKVNDTFGHDGGDAALRHVAGILKQCVRDGDLVCRWGGEEFAVVLRNSALEGAEIVAERIRQEVQRQSLMVKREGAKEAERHPLTISIGAAPFRILPQQPRPSSRSSEINIHAENMLQNIPTSLTSAISEADAALYAAKRPDPEQGRTGAPRHPGRNRIIYRQTDESPPASTLR